MSTTTRQAGGLLLVTMDVESTMEEELHRWYEDEHVPERLSIPGFLRCRRFRAVEGAPKFLALYDLTSPDVLNSPDYRYWKSEGATAWTGRMERNFQNFTRNAYALISDREA